MRHAAVLLLYIWVQAAAFLALTSVTCALRTRAHGREILDSRWQPSASALTLHAHGDKYEDVDAEAMPPRRTIMQCLGTTALTRACHFENVYYNISGNRFVYFGPDGATPDLFGRGLAGEPWLRLIRCASTPLRIFHAAEDRHSVEASHCFKLNLPPQAWTWAPTGIGAGLS